ncbi:MAG TPA: peptide chain release factor 1 [Acetobacteraceae bacterium]
MTETDYTSRLDEIDRLLNDPDVTLEPARVWSLLDELAAALGRTPGAEGFSGHG